MRSFLRELAELEQKILYEGSSYKKSTKQTLIRLIRYVEGGSFTPSKHTKYICRNFRYSIKELTDRWNSNEGIDCEKTEEAFRSQISSVSGQLYQMFGIITECFLNEDTRALNIIDDLLDALDGFPDNICDYIHSDIVDDTKGVSWDSTYDISELRDTIELLRPYLRSNINGVLAEIDNKKLSYIINTINSPIMNNTTRKINAAKIDILREFAETNNVNKSIEEIKNHPAIPFLDMVEDKVNAGLGKDYPESEDNRKMLRNTIKWLSNKQFDRIVDYYRISAQDMITEITKAREALARNSKTDNSNNK